MSTATRGYRSLFWPIILIGVGVVWLLGNLGILSDANLVVLAQLWPLALIAIGLDLIIGRRSPALGAAIGVGVVVLLVILMLAFPRQVTRETFVEPLAGATAANVNLDLSVWPVSVTALDADSENLMEARVAFYDTDPMELRASGDETRTVSLTHALTSYSNFSLGFFRGQADRWQIGLNPTIPIDLNIGSSVGNMEIDLTGTQLRALNVNGAVGNVDIRLPVVADGYPLRASAGTGALNLILPDGIILTEATISGGVGNLNVQIGRDARVPMRLSGGVGSVTVSAPDDAAIRLEVRDRGLGSVNVPSRLSRVSGEGSTGVWETPGFESAANQITIVVTSVGVGSFTLR